jgi:hypothetical protein
VLTHARNNDTMNVRDAFRNALKNGQKFLAAYENSTVECSVPVIV